MRFAALTGILVAAHPYSLASETAGLIRWSENAVEATALQAVEPSLCSVHIGSPTQDLRRPGRPLPSGRAFFFQISGESPHKRVG